MTQAEKFSLPDIGLTAAFPPCRECYEMIERESFDAITNKLVRPGSRLECHSCRNVLITTLLEKADAPRLDRFAPLDATSHKHDLVSFLFDAKVYTETTAKSWLEIHGLGDFVVKSHEARERNFIHFSKDEKAMVDVYVPIERGVYGRCAAREHNGGLVGASA